MASFERCQIPIPIFGGGKGAYHQSKGISILQYFRHIRISSDIVSKENQKHKKRPKFQRVK